MSNSARSIKMYKNTAIMFLVRGLSMIITFISAPIMLNHVDRADYGVLLTLTSIISWVSLMDVGLGNGLRNKLPEYIAKGDTNSAKTIVSTCYASLACYIVFLIILFIVISPFIDWLNLLNSPTSNHTDIRNLAFVIFIAFCLQFLLGLINSILFAFQMPAYQSVFVLLSQVLSLFALIVQVKVFNVSSVFYIGAVNCIIPTLVLAISSLWLFKTKFKMISPSYKYIDFKSIGNVLSLGVKFFILQIITIVLFQANSLIIAKVVGPESVVEYNLAFKYMSVLMMVFNIVITPIWSATTEAYVKKDFAWIYKTLKFSRRISIIAIIVGFIMLLVSKYAYQIWLGKGSIDINFMTTCLIYISISFEMLYKVYGTIINGIGKVYAQMIITGIIAILYIPTAIYLGYLWGLRGVLMANILVFICNYIWSKIQCYRLINQTATGIWNR